MSGPKLFRIRIVLETVVVAEDELDACNLAFEVERGEFERTEVDDAKQITTVEQLEDFAQRTDSNLAVWLSSRPIIRDGWDPRTCKQILDGVGLVPTLCPCGETFDAPTAQPNRGGRWWCRDCEKAGGPPPLLEHQA